ncbi:MAG: Ig-like domain-containing protein, partial [Opitutales bacterium]
TFDVSSAVPNAQVIFIVHRQTGLGASQLMGGDLQTTDANGKFVLGKNGNPEYLIASDVNSSSFTVNTLRITQGSQGLWINGSPIGYNNEDLIIAALTKLGHNFTGDVAELLVYDQPVNSVNRKKIEGYLAHKWGLAGNLDPNHLFKIAPPSFGGPQGIMFDSLVDKAVGDDPFPLSAVATSGLPVSYVSSNPTVATITGNVVTVISQGTTLITATQNGDERYDAAPPLARELKVVVPGVKTDQVITFNPIGEMTRDDPPFELNATSSSGLPVSFSVDYGPATVSPNGIITLDGAVGAISVTARQSGSAYVNPAVPVTRIVVVSNKQRQTIQFPPLGQRGGIRDLPIGRRPIPIPGISSSSGIPVIFTSSDPNIVEVIRGKIIMPKQIGIVTITAHVPGSDIYLPATPVHTVLNIVPPGRNAWRMEREGDLRFDEVKLRFVRRMQQRRGLDLATAEALFDDDSADSDGDGYTNLVERAFGMDSLGPDKWMNRPYRVPHRGDKKQRISFNRYQSSVNAAGENLIYKVEASLDMRTWSENGVSLERTIDIGGGMERVVFVMDDPLQPGKRQYLRVDVLTP